MRITLNLASRPHVDLRPYLQRIRLWMALLLVLAFTLWTMLGKQQSRALATKAEQDTLRQNTERLQKEHQSFQLLMGKPQNADVLQQSEFLNHLFQEKSFSWTAVMMDLENVLPAGVQVSAIEPSISKEGAVSIRLRVTGPRDKSVDLIRNLEHSKRFVSPYLAGESAETGNNLVGAGAAAFQTVSASSQVTFDIVSEYNPLAKTEKSEAPKTASPVAVKKIAAVKPSAGELEAQPAKAKKRGAR